MIKVYPDGHKESVEGKYFPKTLTFGYRPVLTLNIKVIYD